MRPLRVNPQHDDGQQQLCNDDNDGGTERDVGVGGDAPAGTGEGLAPLLRSENRSKVILTAGHGTACSVIESGIVLV